MYLLVMWEILMIGDSFGKVELSALCFNLLMHFSYERQKEQDNGNELVLHPLKL